MARVKSFEPTGLDVQVLQALKNAGWFPDRSVEITSQVKRLEESGWEIFDLAADLLKSIDGLPNNGKKIISHGHLVFSCSVGYDAGDLGKYWHQINGDHIFPIGSYYGENIYLSSSGNIMTTMGEYGFDVYGNDIYEGINNLFLGNRIGSVEFDFDAIEHLQ